MSKIFVTGINGFVGRHLVKQYPNDEIIGLVKTSNEDNFEQNVKIYQGDILNGQRIEEILNEVKPDMVFHLAALTSPAESLKNPIETINNNVEGQLNILEAIRKSELDTKVLIVSSAEVYGKVDSSALPVSEEATLRPATPYAVSKIAQDFLGYQYFIAYGVKAIRVRPFNHIGPGQAPVFVVSAFARQIALIEKGKQESVIRVGNLEPKKDFTDVRDVVNAYRLLMEKGKFGDVYNIGSGKSYKISEILEMLLSFTDKKIEIKIDENLVRKFDIDELRCDNTKIRSEIGWEPAIPIEDSLRDVLDYWRDTV